MADCGYGMFGDGRTHGNPVSRYVMSRVQPSIGITVRLHLRCSSLPFCPQFRPSSLMRMASSPTVSPYIYGIRNSLTKEKKPGSTMQPSILLPPNGLGLSRTITPIPFFAQARITSPRVLMKV